ncbi:unnamed protein product [Closterium sp. NIES-64]|nr:unnamed protein product [Closterium sp. NIES-64]
MRRGGGGVAAASPHTNPHIPTPNQTPSFNLTPHFSRPLDPHHLPLFLPPHPCPTHSCLCPVLHTAASPPTPRPRHLPPLVAAAGGERQGRDGALLAGFSAGGVLCWRGSLLAGFSAGGALCWRDSLLVGFSAGGVLCWRGSLLAKFSAGRVLCWRLVLVLASGDGAWCWRLALVLVAGAGVTALVPVLVLVAGAGAGAGSWCWWLALGLRSAATPFLSSLSSPWRPPLHMQIVASGGGDGQGVGGM